MLIYGLRRWTWRVIIDGIITENIILFEKGKENGEEKSKEKSEVD